jgi:endonuclease/exonuclease/phosphatase (EEP) superfamily protein YafD
MRAAIALAAPLGIGLFGDLYWGFDLLANFRPHIGVVVLVIALVWWRFDSESAAVLLFAGIVGVSSLAPVFIGSPPPPVGETIEVMTFNVGVSNPNRDAVARFIASERPDLVFLFESSFEWENAMKRAGLPLEIVSVVPRGRVAGVTVLASAGIDADEIDVDIRGEVAAVTVTVDGRRVDVIGVHPPSPISPDRAGRRDEMIAETGDWVADRSNPVVVVGDFNATPWSAAHRTLRWRGMLADSLAGAGLQATWPDGWGPLSIPIDHVLHTRDLGSADRRTGPSFESAHRPVLVSIGLAG